MQLQEGGVHVHHPRHVHKQELVLAAHDRQRATLLRTRLHEVTHCGKSLILEQRQYQSLGHQNEQGSQLSDATSEQSAFHV